MDFRGQTTRTNVHFVDIVRRPYRSLANRPAPFGLDLLGLHGKKEEYAMATYRVKWEELSPGAKYPAHKATTVSASSMAEARAKVRQKIMTNVKVTNVTAVKIS